MKLAALLLVLIAAVPALRAQAPVNASPGTGAFPALMEADPGLPTHIVYRPKDLSTLGATRLPIVVWGNGACVNVGNAFRHFLTEIASHGYLAIAIGPMGPELLRRLGPRVRRLRGRRRHCRQRPPRRRSSSMR